MYQSDNYSYINIGEHPYEVVGIVRSKSLLDYSIYVIFRGGQ